MHRHLEPHVLRLEITLSRGAFIYKSGSYVINLREMCIPNRQHEYLKQQMKCNWREETNLPCHHPLKMTASMVPEFLQKNLLMIRRVIRYADSSTLKMPLYAVTPNDLIAQPLQTPIEDPSMQGISDFHVQKLPKQ